ncbi:regulator [Kitasatospora sp. NBC_01287]|uniref:regulator n=1 Tax=Kitasatospora sp. NBC_01287 TaxID=2903573 RepID=UPI002257592C|nr:regulator [Kitasatospora sp. NBC_01287]MCX4749511.1 regulator [Kitasatospora sp. NBC_01287]
MPQRPATDSPAYGPLDPLDPHERRGEPDRPAAAALPGQRHDGTALLERRPPVPGELHPAPGELQHLARAADGLHHGPGSHDPGSHGPDRTDDHTIDHAIDHAIDHVIDGAGDLAGDRDADRDADHVPEEEHDHVMGVLPHAADQEVAARADVGRAQNPLLAALIEEAGFSHAGLARRVDQLGLEHGLDLRYDKTSVTRWLRGQQPRGATPALIAEVFTRRLGRRLSAQDIGLDACAPVYAGLEFAETPQEAVDIVASMWRKDTGPQSELRRIAFTPAGLVVPSRDWLIGRGDEQVARDGSAGIYVSGPDGPLARLDPTAEHGDQPSRTATATVTTAPGVRGTPAGRVPSQARRPLVSGTRTAALPGQGGPGAEPAGRPQRAGLRVGRGDIAAVRAVGDLFRALDNAYGGGHARQALVRYLESEAEPMLRGRYGEQIGRALFAAVADLTRLAGWTSFDIAAHGLAQRYFVQALRLSQAAGDRVLGGYVLITMSQQAVHLGHGREAVQLARVAQQGVGTAAPATVQSLMHAAEARGHGVLGDVRSCTTALVRSERALALARSGDELPSWARFFDEAQLADEFAHCYRDLQQWRPAAQHAEKSLRLRGAAYARSRVFCRIVLSAARLGLGDVDESCALATEALRAAGEMRSARTVEYLRDFHRRLAPYRGSAAARAFEEAARQAGVL